MNSGLQYLEHLQERVYTSLGTAPSLSAATLEDLDREGEGGYGAFMKANIEAFDPSMSPEEMAGLYDYLVRAYREPVDRGQTTRYQDLNTYNIIAGQVSQIEDAATELSLTLPDKRPTIGTLPTGQVNAQLIAVPQSDEYIVALDEGLFIFALLLSKVIAAAFPFTGEVEGQLQFSTDDDEIDKNLTQNSDIRRRFTEVVVAYLLFRTPSAAPPYYAGRMISQVALMMLHSMESFVIGHEYGHLIAGHLTPQKARASFISGEEVEELLPSWREEFVADYVGLRLLLQARTKLGFDVSLSYWGADFFFSCLEIVERGLSILRAGDEDHRPLSNSHPPPEERRQMLRAHMELLLPERGEEPIDLGMKVERIVDRLWEMTRPTFLDFYANGRRPARVWRLHE